MALRFHNTLGGGKQEFSTIESGVVRMYNCGPTVYDYATIGNFRSFLLADLLRRYLEYRGYRVVQVMNITDVGHLTDDADEGTDKVEQAARNAHVDPYEITRRYEGFFHEDAKALRIVPASHYPRATEHIREILALVGGLVDKGYAYAVEGEVYYDISRFPAYGRLSGNRLENLRAGSRVAVNERKRNPLDFALWKTDPRHLMQWDSPWGRGFPGWHVECSAMAMKYLGPSIDIHTGGQDNIFPHHECEIAQSEAYSGRRFVKYWLHALFLLVNGEKMSKSLGNFFTARDLLNKGHSGRAIRYALMNTHYRQHLNFTMEGLNAAAAALERIDNFVRRLREATGADDDAADKNMATLLRETRSRFEESLDDDLNVSGGLGALFDLIREANKTPLSRTSARGILDLLADLDRVLGFLDVAGGVEEAPAEVTALAQKREDARRRRDWAQADALRGQMTSAGWAVEDTPGGPRLRKL